MAEEIKVEKSQEFKNGKLEIALEIFKLEAEKDKAKKQVKDVVIALRETIADIDARILEKRLDFAKNYIEPSLFDESI